VTQDVNKVGDKYSSDLDGIVERASAVLAEETDDGAQADKRRDQFVALLRQHEAAVQQQAGQLKLLVDLHAGELIQTLADIRNVALDKFADVKNNMQQCYRLTDDFRRYAVEVGSSCGRYTATIGTGAHSRAGGTGVSPPPSGLDA